MALALLLGAGCVKTTPVGETGSSSATKTDSKTTTTVPASSIAVTKAESTVKGTLVVEFAVGDELAKGATGYRLMLANQANPTWPMQGYWYELGPDHRAKVWRVPSGKRHLRVCVVKDDKCAEYSENKEVDVK